MCCGKPYEEKEFYTSNSILYRSLGRVPYCKSCLYNLYSEILEKYGTLGYNNLEQKAIERVCMVLDVYYSDECYRTALKQHREKQDTPLIQWYMKNSRMTQYCRKNYNDTIDDKLEFAKRNNIDETTALSMYVEEEKNETIEAATKFFGSGFSNDDYMYLSEQYADWVARHECETKSQEEIFKRLCFTQLELLKATRNKEDTKALNKTFLDQLEAAKLQPKQNKGETVSDAQTFGTLIDKWENTRPIPEVEEELKDVDKIGYLIHVFYTGHIAKVLNLKSSLTNLYDNYIKKYTVDKQEYKNDSDNEALFDTIFGKKNIDEQDI